MSDDNKVELVAAAQINAFAGPPAGIEFNSNAGFHTATRSAAGSYVLELNHGHHTKKFDIQVSRNNQAPGMINASILDSKHIQVLTFDVTGTPTDSPFFITVSRIGDHDHDHDHHHHDDC